MPRYFARSASDRTDDWPLWFVADDARGGLNVTAEIQRKLGCPPGIPALKSARMGDILMRGFAAQPFLPPWDAVKLAMRANREIGAAGLSGGLK